MLGGDNEARELRLSSKRILADCEGERKMVVGDLEYLVGWAIAIAVLVCTIRGCWDFL